MACAPSEDRSAAQEHTLVALTDPGIGTQQNMPYWFWSRDWYPTKYVLVALTDPGTGTQQNMPYWFWSRD